MLAEISSICGQIITILTIAGMIFVWAKKPMNYINSINDNFKKLAELIEKLNDDINDLRRSNLINFSHDLDMGETRSEEQFRQILDDGQAYLDAKQNGYGKQCYKNIQAHYEKLKEKERM